MRSTVIIFITFLLTTVCNNTKREFHYQNPIHKGLIVGIRDAQIFQDNDGKYYLIGTSYPFWPQEGKNPGVRIYSSDSITGWKYEKLLIDRESIDTCSWYLDRFWAPEIHKIKGKYYLLFNSLNESSICSPNRQLHGFVAVADHILGDYHILTMNRSLMEGNDLTFFLDDDGKVYAYNNGRKKIQVSEIDIEKMEKKMNPLICLTPGDSARSDWDYIGIEGTYVIKNENLYYMFYSSWSRGYEIGYATAQSPLGPWKKFEGNPVYGAQNENACKRYGLKYTANQNNPWHSVGHNQVFKGPDGKWWISCHGILKGENQKPGLVIDPFEIINGEIIIKGPTFDEQVIVY